LRISVGCPSALALRGALQVGAAQQGLDPRQQFGQRERLGQVVVGAQLQAQHAVEFGRLGGEHQDRRGTPARAQRLADLEPVHAGHHQVQDQQVAGLLVLARQCGHAVGHGLHLVVRALRRFMTSRSRMSAWSSATRRRVACWECRRQMPLLTQMLSGCDVAR
jgi:hypothetical protein